MLYLVSVIAMLSYALQGVFMAGPYRRSPLWATAYRGLALGITMAPLLLLAPQGSMAKLLNMLPVLILACLAASIANWGQGNALRHLPIGIMSGIIISTSAVCQGIGGYLAFGDSVSMRQAFFMLLVVCLAATLAFSRSFETEHVSGVSSPRGALIAFGAGTILAVGFLSMVHISRTVSPFVAAWAWEFGIGICAALGGMAVHAKSGARPPPFREFITVLLSCSPTVAGTGFYAYATTLGPVQIPSAIAATGIAAACVLGRIIRKERLSVRDWILVSSIVAAVIALRVFP